MHYLILAVGSYGDVLPLVGLARQLKVRGHSICFFSSDNFSQMVREAGLEFVALGTTEDYDEVANNPNLWHPHKGWRIVMQRLTRDTLHFAYTTLCDNIKPNNTTLISSTLGFASRLVQETHHIPLVSVHFSPGVFHSAYAPPQLPHLHLPDWLPIIVKQGIWRAIDFALIDPVVKPPLNTFRKELGLSPVSRIFHSWLHSPDRVVGLFPDWFAPPQPDWPPHTVLTGFPLYDHTHDAVLPSKIQKFLYSHPRPFVFTPGSANKFGGKFFAEAVKACEQVKQPAILLTRYPEQLPRSLPSSIQHFSYVPLSQLLPQSSGLIHHGGIGTSAQALRAGIPQLIQPMAFDQFDNAARIQGLGVGETISTRHFRAQIIADHLRNMMSNSQLKIRCQAIQDLFKKANSLEATCDIIEKIAPSSL